MSPSQQPIGIFDSGVGGLSVANAIVEYLPLESFCYYGDTAHVPYGPQPAAAVRTYSLQISRFLLDQGCKLIVVACNTATAAALPLLRQTWPEVPFVGMEPAVKPAARATRSGKVGVLATRGTFQSERYQLLMQQFGRQIEVLENPCQGLVERIEAGETEGPGMQNLLRSILHPMQARGADTFVLGCTHYPFVKPLIETIAGPQSTVIDPAPAVARQVGRLLSERGLLSSAKGAPDRFFASGSPDSLLRAGTHLLGRTLDVRRSPVLC